MKIERAAFTFKMKTGEKLSNKIRNDIDALFSNGSVNLTLNSY